MAVIVISDGTGVEVSEEFALAYAETERAERLLERKETRRHQSLDKSLEHGFDVADPNTDVFAEVVRQELAERLKRALLILTDKQYTVFLLHALYEYSFQKIGKCLNLHKDTIREHYISAIKKLKKFLQTTPSK